MTINLSWKVKHAMLNSLFGATSAGANSAPPPTPGRTATAPSPSTSAVDIPSFVPSSSGSPSPSARAPSSRGRTAATGSRKLIRPLETHEQQAVIAWAALAVRTWPELELLHAVPNGAVYGRDKRLAAMQAARLKAEGLRRGWPDLNLPVARGPFIGLVIEMKRRGERPTDDQRHYLDLLAACGHRTRVCFSAQDAIDELRAYLALPPTQTTAAAAFDFT